MSIVLVPFTLSTPGSTTAFSTVQVASLIVGVFLPILVGLVTKTITSGALKSILLLLLSAISGFVTEFINNPSNFDWRQALLTFGVTFITGVATYYGLWKPTGVTAAAQRFPRSLKGGNTKPPAPVA